MPLSEYEQRVLAQMEEQLHSADPGAATSLPGGPRRIDIRRLSLGILITLLGIGALVAGVAIGQVWLGVLGFVSMLLGALLGMTLTSGTISAPRKKREASGFMDKQNERWERRQDG